MALTKFLNPKNDFAFKRIFGTEKNQDILIQFINDILSFEGANQVSKVSFLSEVQNPEIASKKQSAIDVLCTDGLGRQYIIEMQVGRFKGFEKRAQYYAAKAYSGQLAQGDGYDALKEIIFIAICDFVMFENKPSYYSTHVILDRKTQEHDLRDFSFTFLELPKFNKNLEELSSLIDRWAYFFKYAEATQEQDVDQVVGMDEAIKRAYSELNRFYWSDAELNTYERAEKQARDAKALLEQKLDEAVARGEAIGLEKGEVIGLEKGRVEGRAEGVQTMLLALQLLKVGESVETVAKKTGLHLEEVRAMVLS